jgi:hypothetical protein
MLCEATLIDRQPKPLLAARTQRVEWTKADAKAALAEGWGLFLATQSGIMRIGRIANGQLVRFPHDEAAIAHVRRRVDERSDLHRRAWYLDGKTNRHAQD